MLSCPKAITWQVRLEQLIFCCSEHGVHFGRLGLAGTGGYKTRHSVPYTLFFNKLYYRHKLYSYINNSHEIREPSLVRLSPSGLFFCTGKHSAHFRRSNQHSNTCKTGHNRPSILLFNRIHCRYKLDRYIRYFCDVQEL